MANAPKTTIAEVAPTLADLKKLSLVDQSVLLLARLAEIYPQVQSVGGFHKGNLSLPNDPYGLAAGYHHENSEIRRHLLGAPWTRLVNDGYIVDPAGSGFYTISDEGYEALKDPEPPADQRDGKVGPAISERLISRSESVGGSNSHRMPRTADVINVLIASPSDVSEERGVVERAILDWNATHFSIMGIMLNPLKWESHAYPASGDRPQAIINRQIVDSGDILIAIFGYKLGTPTGAAQSGTIEEIEEFRRAGKYVALYFSTADVPRSADRVQLEALESYKKDREKDTLYFEFEDASGLRDHLTKHLPKIVHEVHENLNPSSLAQGMGPEMSGQVKNLASERGHSATRSPTSLADIISELEDNLDCASRPRTGDAYRRPSTRVWLENRNKINLPPDIHSQVKNIYNRISSWGDVVASGLNPNLGSMELNLIVSDLRSSLPPLIDRLRKLQNLNWRRKD